VREQDILWRAAASEDGTNGEKNLGRDVLDVRAKPERTGEADHFGLRVSFSYYLASLELHGTSSCANHQLHVRKRMSRTTSAVLLAAICFCGLACVGLSAQEDFPVGARPLGYFCRALGDSLTAAGSSDRTTGFVTSFPGFLQTLGSCTAVSNEGVAGQTSTQIAVRSGGLATTATIAGGTIPASGPVGVSFKAGYEPVTRYSSVGVAVSISGVEGIAAHIGSGSLFTRSNPGPPVASPANAPVTVLTGSLNDGFVIIWAGKNNAFAPAQVLSDIAAMVAFLPSPKKFVILSVTNSDMPAQWGGASLYKIYQGLNASLASTYPQNYLDIRSLLVDAYNPEIPEDVIDHGHDVMPFSLRLYGNSTLAAAVTDTTGCTGIPAITGSSVQIDAEKIYVSAAKDGFATADGCTRGFAGTSAATHVAGAPLHTVDPTHLNPAGQAFVAQQINAWMSAKYGQNGRAGAARTGTTAAVFASPPAIGATVPPVISGSEITAGASFGSAQPASVVGSVEVIYGGVGDSSAPPVKFSNGATGTAVMSGTSVLSILLTSSGTPSTTPITVAIGGSPTKAAYAVVTPKHFALLVSGPSATMPNVSHTLYGPGACILFAANNGANNAKMCGSGNGNYMSFYSKGLGGIALGDGSVVLFRNSAGAGSAQLGPSPDGNSIQVGGAGGIAPASNSVQTSGLVGQPWATTFTKGFVCAIATKKTSYGMTAQDCTILCNASTGAVTITLPDTVTANIYHVKKIDATANICTVSGGGHTIDGATDVRLSKQYADTQIQGDQTQWWVLR